MPFHLPDADAFDAFDVIELDEYGALLDRGKPVPPAGVDRLLASFCRVPEVATDIFVHAHGWRQDERRALAAARRMFSAIWRQYHEDPGRYPALGGFRPHFIAIRWPSMSRPFRAGYTRIRDRAHAMTTSGHAAHVLAGLLGYLARGREPLHQPGKLRNARGQYLHCLGHSFGCRLMGEAILEAATPRRRRTLAWPWTTAQPFAVDGFLGFQMAAPPDIFAGRFRALAEGRAPIVGPVALTVSRHDRALSLWHQRPEGSPGLGAVGAAGAPTITLHRMEEPYLAAEFSKVTNVDAAWRYRRGGLLAGAHSDIWHPESVHLVLSLAELSRPDTRAHDDAARAG
jgi:hypothetical protein